MRECLSVGVSCDFRSRRGEGGLECRGVAEDGVAGGEAAGVTGNRSRVGSINV